MKILAIECAREHMSEVRARLEEVMTLRSDKGEQLSLTIKFIPLRPDDITSEDMLRQLFLLQKKYVKEVRAVTIFNINNVEWTMPNGTVTFSQHLSNAKHGANGKKFVLDVEESEDDDRVYVLVYQADEQYVCKWLRMIRQFLVDVLKTTDWMMQ